MKHPSYVFLRSHCHLMKCNIIEINSLRKYSLKASLSDCCVVPTDAWRPLGVFGVMSNPQNVHNVHVHSALL